MVNSGLVAQGSYPQVGSATATVAAIAAAARGVSTAATG